MDTDVSVDHTAASRMIIDSTVNSHQLKSTRLMTIAPGQHSTDSFKYNPYGFQILLSTPRVP
jgi:hypothetical protein